MLANDADFTRYASDFYTEKLPEHAKQHMLASTERLRAFFNQQCTCRWVELLGAFEERAPFASCGSCDVCKTRKEHAGDLERDLVHASLHASAHHGVLFPTGACRRPRA